MTLWNYQSLRPFQGQMVVLTSTEEEVMVAKVLLVDDEHENLVLEVLSTSQPERYERLGSAHAEGGWVIPFAYIADIVLEDRSMEGGRDRK